MINTPVWGWVLPGPTARTFPSVGRTLLSSGIRSPPDVCVSVSLGQMRQKLDNGVIGPRISTPSSVSDSAVPGVR